MVGNAGDIAAIASDPRAFEAFYRAHVDDVQRFIARRVDDPHQAADLTANVFIAVIESAGSYRASRGEPLAWLYGVARNVVASERRRRARWWRLSGRISGRELLSDDDVTAIEERIDAEAGSRELYRAMDRLSAKDRAVLELVALDGLSVQDAAATLGIRPGAARARLHRARSGMRAMLPSPDPIDTTAHMEVAS
ncbi:RNA polymerase sigma factor [Stackebrandtia soli]|uniref:RNA polymerase sigma factor n=1 Tax=Stackebrandtia soli TaxID=1892856 RepID=UPI0039EB91A3